MRVRRCARVRQHMTKPTVLGLPRRFGVRFNDVLLQAPQAGTPDAQAPPCADAPALELALAALCQPGPRYASASHTLAATPAERVLQQAWVTQRLLALDGTLHMQSLGGPWRQRLHRLTLKLHEAAGGSAAVWDCGSLINSAAALRQAEGVFLPRRPTLMLAWQLPPATLRHIAQALQARQAAYPQAVRLWVLNAPDCD